MSNNQKASSKSALALRHVLQNHVASEIETRDVIEIDSKTPPSEAAKTLWKHNILGAPVYDETTKTYLGFFDARDILSTVVATHKDEQLRQAQMGPGAKTRWIERLSVETSYLAKRNPFISCKENTPLEKVCRLLMTHKCHRIPVLGADGRCCGILSQSALVKFLVDHVQDDLNQTLEEAQLAYKKPVLSVKDTTPAIEAFDLLDSKRLSGIAVVDEEDGHLVGNTSARDIKMVASDDTGSTATMDQDILTYLALVRQATPSKKERYPSTHVSETSTVGHAIRLLAKTGYHRVFVVDEKIRPVGVISVADIIDFVVGGSSELSLEQ